MPPTICPIYSGKPVSRRKRLREGLWLLGEILETMQAKGLFAPLPAPTIDEGSAAGATASMRCNLMREARLYATWLQRMELDERKLQIVGDDLPYDVEFVDAPAAQEVVDG